MKSLARVLLAFALVTTLALPFLPPASAATVDSATWGAPGAPVQASPGDTARPLSISIRNSDTSAYTNVHATIGSVDGITPVPGGDSATLAGTWNGGDVFVAKFFVNIAPNASVDKVYSLPLTITDAYPKTTVEFTNTYSVPVRLTGHPVLTLSTTPSTLVANATTDITLSVRNTGDGPAGAVSLALAPASGSGLTLVRTDSTRSLGGLLPGDSKLATFTVHAPSSGNAALTAQVSYADSAGASATESHTLYFELATSATTTAPARENVTVSLAQDHLDSGRPGALTFTVTNGMDDAMSGAIFALDTTTSTSVQTVGASNTQVLGDIAPGASRVATVNFITTNGATGILKLTAHAKWQTSDGTAVDQTYDFGIALLGTVDVQLSGAASSLTSTGSAVVTGTLTNLGNALAHNAYVNLVGGGGYAATEPTYLGDINPNSALPFTLTTTANATAANGTAGGPGAFPGGGGGGGFGNRTGGGFGNGTGGGFGNGTRGPRGALGGNAVVFLVQWNDDYGTLHTAILNSTVRARTTSATGAGTNTASSASKAVPAIGIVGIVGGAALAAAVGAALVRRHRRSKE